MNDTDLLARELAAEQAHVDAVYARLDIATRSARSVAHSGRQIYQSDRQSWMREEDGTALFERDAFTFQAARRLATLDAEHEGLVFGRLDLSEPAQEIRYIGRIGVRDDEYEPLVIDWRARAAEPFYRATPTRPMDVIRRRVLRCRSDQVVGIEDDLLDAGANTEGLPIIGEGALMASLARARGTQMKDIVATIQAEQDEAIRADYAGVTIISGGPGTGKTVVALHRAAYLLYSNRRRFERGGILVVGPGPLFMNYIERVLPSLGEDSVTLKAVGGVASDVLSGLSSDVVDDAATAFVKGSLRMVPLLKNLVSLPLVNVADDSLRVRVTVKGNVLTLGERALARIRSGVLAHHKVNRGRDAAERALITALAAQVPAEVDLEEDAIRDLIGGSASVQMFLNAWWPPLNPVDLLRRLGDPGVTRAVASDLLDTDEQDLLTASFGPEAELTVADMALLDELAALLGPVPAAVVEDDDLSLDLLEGSGVQELVSTGSGPAVDAESLTDDTHETYAHLLVDESQDITPMQWRMLRRRGSQASWTIVGDLAQSSWPDLDEVGRAVGSLIGNAPHREFRLSVNYRSPAEVFTLASRIVTASYPGADMPRAVRSTGIRPDLRVSSEAALLTDLAEIVDELTEAVGGTVGLIAPPSRLDRLRHGLEQRLATRMNPATLARVLPMSPLEAKGLEYDAVVVVAPDEIVAESPGGVRVLYVALTRPTQRLVTLDIGGVGTWQAPLTD
ncbi:MAG: HelD family protein [Propioniciclava sp.]